MENKTQYLLIFIFLIFTIESLNAQLIEKKLNIYIDTNTGSFLGKKSSNEDEFIYPYLYPNMTKLNGYGVKAPYRAHSLFSFGIEGNKMFGTEWVLGNNNLYEGAEASMQSVSPVFQIHTKFKKTGIFNQLKLYVEIAPVFGQSKLQLKNPIFEINPVINSSEDLMESIDNYFGIKGGAGAEFSFSNDVGLFLTYSIQRNYISSTLYNDKSFIYNQLSIGLFFRFIYNKRYAY